jgi:hypothetical protein
MLLLRTVEILRFESQVTVNIHLMQISMSHMPLLVCHGTQTAESIDIYCEYVK